MPNCGAYERGAVSTLPQHRDPERVALQNSRCLSPLLATASLVERVALPEKHGTIVHS
jgi:hypothetical protein